MAHDVDNEWIDQDDLFKKELNAGYGWQKYVATRLNGFGFDVHIPELEVRQSKEEIPRFSDEPDILWAGRTIEVKSRKLFFTSPEDFPYDTILVDTVNGWSTKSQKPHEYICVSTETGQMICLGGETHTEWLTCKRYDHTRKINDFFYEAHKSLWVPIEVMVAQMHCYLKV